jgi:hypothetical protein
MKPLFIAFLLISTAAAAQDDWSPLARQEPHSTMPSRPIAPGWTPQQEQTFNRNLAQQTPNNFGLPEEIADEVKARCAKIFPVYDTQVTCIELEAKAYLKLHPPYDPELYTAADCNNPTLTEGFTTEELAKCRAGNLQNGETKIEQQEMHGQSTPWTRRMQKMLDALPPD